MSDWLSFTAGWPVWGRILLIVVLAAAAHLLVRSIRAAGRQALTGRHGDYAEFIRRHNKFASIQTLLVSALTFVVYFGAIGLILSELGVSLTAYLASASVIGLAVGFGSQGLVQDVVTGVTLIFSDVLDVGDVVDVGGQTGRIERVGLRFTTLVNLLGQTIYVPNRSIGQINRYRNGYVRVYVDVQVPDGMTGLDLHTRIEPLARGMYRQYGAIVLTEPEFMGVHLAEPGDWSYLRLKFRVWPGQGALIETAFRQRLLAMLRRDVPDYADWMITVTYRAPDP